MDIFAKAVFRPCYFQPWVILNLSLLLINFVQCFANFNSWLFPIFSKIMFPVPARSRFFSGLVQYHLEFWIGPLIHNFWTNPKNFVTGNFQRMFYRKWNEIMKEKLFCPHFRSQRPLFLTIRVSDKNCSKMNAAVRFKSEKGLRGNRYLEKIGSSLLIFGAKNKAQLLRLGYSHHPMVLKFKFCIEFWMTIKYFVKSKDLFVKEISIWFIHFLSVAH